MLKARKAIDNMTQKIVWMVLTLENVDTGMVIARNDAGKFYVIMDRNEYDGLGYALERAMELYHESPLYF